MPRSRRSRRGFQYRANDPEEGRRVASTNSDYDNPLKGGTKTFKAKDGKNQVRIMPRTWDDEDGPRHWGIEVYVHYGIGADNSAYLCPRKMRGEPCPICDERDRLAAAGDEEGARELRATKRVLAYVIDRNNEGEGPIVWWMPAKAIAQEIADRSEDEGGKLLKIDLPEDGYDVSFKKSGTGRKTDYSSVDVARRPSPISDDDDEMDDWLEQIEKTPLPDLLNFYDADYLEKVFSGTVSRSGSDDDEESEAPRSRRSRHRSQDNEDDDDRGSRRRRRHRDDDDEDDDPPPRSRRRRTRDDEDEDDEEVERSTRRRRHRDDDDEDDEQPRRRKARKIRDDDLDQLDEPDDDEDDDEDDEPRRGRHRDLRDEVTSGLRSRRRRRRD